MIFLKILKEKAVFKLNGNVSPKLVNKVKVLLNLSKLTNFIQIIKSKSWKPIQRNLFKSH